VKISYILQLKDFLILLIIGFFVGILYGILNIFTQIKNRNILQIIIDIFFILIAFLIFILAINIINWGEFRLFLLVGYLLGFAIERIILGKIFAKLYKKVYTFIVKILKKFTKSKIGEIIFK